MTTPVPASVLEHALVVQHDHVSARPIAVAGGLVVEPASNAFRLDLSDHVIFPGLVNSHDHLQLNSIPPLVHAEPFPNSYAWIDAFAAHRQRAAVVAAVNVPSAVRHWHGGLKNLLAGVTTVAHHDPWHAVFDDPDFPVGVLRDFGWSHSLGLGLAPAGGATRYGPAVRESFYTTATAHPWMIHLAEGTDAVARGELAQLDALGCLRMNTVIVHGAGMTRADVDRVIDRDAATVWCPMSNLGMLGATLDPRRLADAGRLALGSDSRLTGSRDLLDEMRVAAGHSDLSARELLRLVTADASRVLRHPPCGGLDVGQQADCIIMRSGSDHHGTLLNAPRSAIRAVVRGGVPAIADHDFADWFAYCDVETVPVRLDGEPKLMAKRLARADAMALEPGLEIV